MDDSVATLDFMKLDLINKLPPPPVWIPKPPPPAPLPLLRHPFQPRFHHCPHFRFYNHAHPGSNINEHPDVVDDVNEPGGVGTSTDGG